MDVCAYLIVSANDCLEAESMFRAISQDKKEITKAQWDEAVKHDYGVPETPLKSFFEDCWRVFDESRDGRLSVCYYSHHNIMYRIHIDFLLLNSTPSFWSSMQSLGQKTLNSNGRLPSL